MVDDNDGKRADAERDITGSTLAGRYVVERRLAMGGMGAVYVAKQEPLGRDVALKVLRPSLLGDPVAVERFKTEAKLVAQLGHPHIISIYEFGVSDDGMLFIAMELVHGTSLGNLLRERGLLPWQRTVPIVCSIARALGAAHARGVVHRDLKPDNILLVDALGFADFVKVVDFGIAKLVKGEEHAPNLTGTGFVPGTPGYIAPEQIMGGGHGDDPRSDLYALGVTWFEMLTGRRPFEGDSAMKIFLAHLQEPVPKVSARAPGVDVPAELEGVLGALLAKNPDERPKNAEELLAIVEAAGLNVPPTPAHASALPHLTTQLSAAMPTMTSLSTPGTSVAALANGGAAPLGTAAAPLSTSVAPVSTSVGPVGTSVAPVGTSVAPLPSVGTQPTPASSTSVSATRAATQALSAATGTATATPAEQQTLIERLLRERTFWTRFWLVAAPLLLAVIVGLVVFIHSVGGREEKQRAERRAQLPVASTGIHASPNEDAVAAAVQAYVDGDKARAHTLAALAMQSYPEEPVPSLVEAAVLDEKRGDDRAKLLRQAAAKVAVMRAQGTHPPGNEGMDTVELLPRAYTPDVDNGAFVAAFRACASCMQSVLALALASEACDINVTDPNDALTFADRIIELAPDKGLGYERKVTILLRKADVHEAVHVADVGLQHAPHSPALHLAAGRAHLAAGEFSDAVSELKASRAGLDENLALADAALLQNDEATRTDLVRVLRSTAGDAHDICEIARQHGPSLIGAGRPHESLELMDDCLKAAHGDRYEATNTFMMSMQAAEALGDTVFWNDLGALEKKYGLDDHAQPAGVTLIVDAVVADIHGDTATARAKLDEMKRREHEPIWPPRAAAQMIAVAESRVAWREHKWDEALAATDKLEHDCRRHARRAEILRDAGRVDEARGEIAKILERKDYCRASIYEGIYVLDALVLRAEMNKDASSVDELRRAMQHDYPRAEETLPVVVRARAILASAPSPSSSSGAGGQLP